jgi:L-malate glycosyltransferase
MQKKTIVHVIDGLGRGGAETLLVDLLPDLAIEYDIILVTLDDVLEFEPEQIVCRERLCINYKGIRDLIPAVLRLKKIIQKYQPVLVRSQLFWGNIITRMACPKKVPYFFSVHATMNEDPIAIHKKYFVNGLERLTYRKWQHMIGVTQAVVNSFTAFHPNHGRTFLLYNYVRNQFFQQPYEASYDGSRPLRLVAVSNLRLIKNIPYLIEAIKLLPQEKLQLDIYGNGPLQADIEALIKEYKLNNVVLKGLRTDIHQILPQYDVFVSTSTVEGFGIAVAEAMSIGLPVIISDIPVYREVGSDKASYLNNKDPRSLAAIVQTCLNGQKNLKKESEENKRYAREMFSKQGYLQKLKEIYRTSEAAI